MKTIAKAIIDLFDMPYQVRATDPEGNVLEEYVERNGLGFQQRVMLEACADKLWWLSNNPKGTDQALLKARNAVKFASRANRNGEIDRARFAKAVEIARDAAHRHEIVERELMHVLNALEEINGRIYVPYGARSVATSAPEFGDLPDDMVAEMRALGIEPEAELIANTNGVETDDAAVG